MTRASRILIAFVAVQHLLFLIVEMFLWQSDAVMARFGTSPEFAAESAVLAMNQGLYNGFLAAGLGWALTQPRPARAWEIASVLPGLRGRGRRVRRAHGQALDPAHPRVAGLDRPGARHPGPARSRADGRRRVSEPDWSTLVAGALAGELAAVEALVRGLQARIYALALRFLWTPEDAEDATQEILIRIITRLSSFEGRSSFTTWAHRVAVNHLLNTKRSRGERAELSFDALERELVTIRPRPEPELELELDQSRQRARIELACLHGMLLCLDRDQRMALVLGMVLQVEGADGAEILGITPHSYRKRLSRAKKRLSEFVGRRCGIVNAANACRCEGWVGDERAEARLRPYLELGGVLERDGEGERLEGRYGEELDSLAMLTRLYRRREVDVPAGVLERIRVTLRGVVLAGGEGDVRDVGSILPRMMEIAQCPIMVRSEQHRVARQYQCCLSPWRPSEATADMAVCPGQH